MDQIEHDSWIQTILMYYMNRFFSLRCSHRTWFITVLSYLYCEISKIQNSKVAAIQIFNKNYSIHFEFGKKNPGFSPHYCEKFIIQGSSINCLASDSCFGTLVSHVILIAVSNRYSLNSLFSLNTSWISHVNFQLHVLQN